MNATETVAADRHAVEELKEKTAQVKRDLQELGNAARAAAKEKWGDLRETAADLEGRMEERIRNKPVQSVLIAAGVGLVIGLLLNRRHD